MSNERYFTNPYDDYNETIHGINETQLVSRENIINLVNKYVQMIERRQDTQQREDLYVGLAGIAFMFWKLSRSEETKATYPCLELATKYINQAKLQSAKKDQSRKHSVAFLCGNAGVAAVSAVISHDAGRQRDMEKDVGVFLEGYSSCARTGGHDADEVLVGRAGYLHEAYWLNQTVTTKPIAKAVIDDICKTVLQRGRNYATSQSLDVPLMYEYHGKQYLGAAHGICAILHALLESPWFERTEDGRLSLSSTKLSDIKASIDHVLALQSADGNFPTRHDSNRFLTHWCHGCAGAIYLFAKAYLIFKEDKYIQSCRKCADAIWRQGLLRKGPGICHGVAGNGYAFLLMYRLTGEKCYLYRAGKFADYLSTESFAERMLAPDRPYSLYEGLAGTVCFLTDLLDPLHSSFPFMDVFETKYDRK